MKYFSVWLFLVAGVSAAQSLGPVTEKPASAVSAQNAYDLFYAPAGTIKNGEVFKIEKVEGKLLVGPAVTRDGQQAKATNVMMPAAVANELVGSQTKLINALTEKILELELRVQKLEGRGRK